MRISSNPSPKNPAVRSIPIRGASPPGHTSIGWLVRLGFVKDGVALVFTATTKPLFQCLERGSAQAATLRQTKTA
jgi:hypothetical protein